MIFLYTMTTGQGVLFTLVMLIGVTLTPVRHIDTLYFYVYCIRHQQKVLHTHTHAYAYTHIHTHTHTYTCMYIYPTEKRQKNWHERMKPYPPMRKNVDFRIRALSSNVYITHLLHTSDTKYTFRYFKIDTFWAKLARFKQNRHKIDTP